MLKPKPNKITPDTADCGIVFLSFGSLIQR